MSALDNLVRQVQDILEQKQEAENALQEAQELTNTTAVTGTYSNGNVIINGQSYEAETASTDINLHNGSLVYCLPAESGGYVIIGSGFC